MCTCQSCLLNRVRIRPREPAIGRLAVFLDIDKDNICNNKHTNKKWCNTRKLTTKIYRCLKKHLWANRSKHIVEHRTKADVVLKPLAMVQWVQFCTIANIRWISATKMLQCASLWLFSFTDSEELLIFKFKITL